MRKVYSGLPHVRVEPLLFSPEDISGERLLAMMKVDDNTREQFYISVMQRPSYISRDATIYGGHHEHFAIDGGQLQL